jgi:septum formation topological specificity factor MinE
MPVLPVPLRPLLVSAAVNPRIVVDSAVSSSWRAAIPPAARAVHAAPCPRADPPCLPPNPQGSGTRQASGSPHAGLPHVCAPAVRRAAPVTAPRAVKPGVAAAPAVPGADARRADRIIRSGDLVATTSGLGTSINYKIKPDGSRVVGGEGTAAPTGPVRDFMDKLWLAWNIFFPEKPPELSPKDGAKQRLRMILVADRCGMSPSGLAEMKKNILKALEEFVDIESEEQIDVSINLEPEVGTIYCVAVPVRRVKPEARAGFENDVEGLQVLEWDPDNKDSDPSSRFPMGC